MELVARRAVAERLTPLGDVCLDDEERGVVEVLPRVVEEEIEDRVARRGRGELGHGLIGDDRAAAPARRTSGGSGALDQGRGLSSLHAVRGAGGDDLRRGRQAQGRRLAGPRARRRRAHERRRARAERRPGGRRALFRRRSGGRVLEAETTFGVARRRLGGSRSQTREEPLQAPFERGAVRPRDRLAHPHHRRDPLHQLEPERERQLLLHLFRQRLGDRDDERAVLDPDRHHRPRRRHLRGHEPARPLVRARQVPERRRGEPERLGEEERERRFVEPGHLQQVRHEIAAVEDLASQRFLDLADRGDPALDDEGAQGHGG